MALFRQHLIDPDVCIRCSTCEDICPPRAIVHDARQYAIHFDKCDGCGKCIPPCPTGAIESYRQTREPYSVPAQLAWESLPEDEAADGSPSELERPQGGAEIPEDVRLIVAEATRTEGVVPPPWSAAHPYVGLYSPSRPLVAAVSGNYRLTDEDAESDIRHIVFDCKKAALPVLEGQSLGIVPPGVDAFGRPHHARLYSIASPRDGERPRHNNLAITVKRISHDRHGAPVRGVASNYLCDLTKGEEVNLTGPYGATFLMPNHPGAKLLLICTGTGAAPMRAMTERRRRRMALREGGSIHLFFGARRPGELPYFGPLSKLPKELVDVELAFSRVADRPKEYVQDRIRARGKDVFELLTDEDSFVYVCGLKEMEEGMLTAFAEVVSERGVAWEPLLARLRAEGRFHLETY